MTPKYVLRQTVKTQIKHGGDFKTTTIAEPLKTVDLGVDISVNTGQICMGFDADSLVK